MHDSLHATRHAALALHKALIETVRIDYEREQGRVETPAELLRLVLEDSRFAWCKPLAAPILAADEPDAELPAIRAELRRVLGAPEFQPRYLELLQRAPEVIVAHAQLQRELG